MFLILLSTLLVLLSTFLIHLECEASSKGCLLMRALQKQHKLIIMFLEVDRILGNLNNFGLAFYCLLKCYVVNPKWQWIYN